MPHKVIRNDPARQCFTRTRNPISLIYWQLQYTIYSDISNLSKPNLNDLIGNTFPVTVSLGDVYFKAIEKQIYQKRRRPSWIFFYFISHRSSAIQHCVLMRNSRSLSLFLVYIHYLQYNIQVQYNILIQRKHTYFLRFSTSFLVYGIPPSPCRYMCICDAV